MVQHVLQERGLNPHDCQVMCGFDGGQGLLKIGFTIAEKSSAEPETMKSKYSDVNLALDKTNLINGLWLLQGIAPKSAKLTSVKKLIVLAAVADVPENYFNVKVILEQLNIEALEFTMAADIKMCKFLQLIEKAYIL